MRIETCILSTGFWLNRSEFDVGKVVEVVGIGCIGKADYPAEEELTSQHIYIQLAIKYFSTSYLFLANIYLTI